MIKGWVAGRRDHGGLIFIDLRDRTGIMQVTLNPDNHPDAHAIAESVRSEWVLEIEGTVESRPEGTQNNSMPTGTIELNANRLVVLNESLTPPFYIQDDIDVDESLRLRYRYLDLRRPSMYKILELRSKVTKFIRDFLDAKGFLEVETPILIKSTPEGARDFLVPSRMQPGSFYALPQSPQQLKQLLMVSGIEKYYQIARCFRDEDLRADRQPEFTQLDLEMSFVSEGDVLDLTESLYTEMINTILPDKKLTSPFPKLTYKQAIDDYGSDKPDLRFDLKMINITEIASKTTFNVFLNTIQSGGQIKAIVVPEEGSTSNNAIRQLTKLAGDCGAPGLAHIRFKEGETLFSPGLSFDDSLLEELKNTVKVTGSDLVLIMGGSQPSLNSTFSAFRTGVAIQFGLIEPDSLAFAFITSFPLFEWDTTGKRWTSSHHPFTAPRDEDMPKLNSGDFENIDSKAYDLVCNGMELASGSIRIHDRATQQKIFEILGHQKSDIQERFGQMLEAFEYGAPPHGGIAPGIDRLIAILSDTDSIRDVIAFPKTQSGNDLLFGSPAVVDDVQLRDLGINLNNS